MAELMRPDRMVSVALVAPLLKLRGVSRQLRIPILMYHGISDALDRQRSPYFRTVTSPRTFAAQLDVLAGDAFEVVSLTQAVRMLRGEIRSREGATPVVITFDDGLLDFYTQAFPLLEARGFTATVFLASACVGGTFPTGDPCMSWVQVRELADRGIDFGSHSMTHSRLVELPLEALEQELSRSKSDIEQNLGRKVTSFSYPFRFPAEDARFTAHLHARLEANGYDHGVTTMVGRAAAGSDLLFLPRLPVNDCDDEALLRAKLAGAYDWFGPVQAAYKKMRSIASPARRAQSA
jgi:peptidoglycan/xylan/chitin deacetylase (PgdA/CDA1 family)